MSQESERCGQDIDQVKNAMDARDAFHTLEHELDHLDGDITRASRRALELTQAPLRELSAAFRAAPKP
jgi:hypothetical protein